ncbi:hypothetical protein GH714_033875 [Hevea brasiliensis]|uniref:N-acetyl-D-glucosamine kinase n=1 Tax=Hevea brasiliensis TaxID=3981 RepID=A0A6A6LLE9_HEVBR|nr:hypothetical protein GH714_033875 [Hevea brasiliensis]
MKLYRNGEIWDFEHEIDVPGHRPVILGLDGRTTSTVCICMPVQPFSNPLPDPLPVLARAVAGCSNHNSVGGHPFVFCMLQKLRLERHWSKFLADALSKSGSNRSAVQAVCLAVSGVNHPTDEQRIFNWLRDIFPSHVKLYVQNDAVAALASGTMGKLHGCVLIAGTGTIAYGFTEHGREARAAGAGPILGSKGHHVLEEFALLGSIGGWTYADPSWARIAALVPVIVSCAEAFDEVANKILQDSVEELALSVKAVVQRLGLCGEDGNASFPLVMVGGVLEANKTWDIGKEVVNCISRDYPGARPIWPKLTSLTLIEPSLAVDISGLKETILSALL